MKIILKKEVIISFIIGAILASGMTVYATTYMASSVTYTKTGTNVNNVGEALNDLYSKVTTYKNLNTNTTATASDILNGKTAYDNLGNLITGSHKESTHGSFVYTSNDRTNDGKVVTNFIPDEFIIYADKGDGSTYMYYYNKNVDSSNFFRLVFNSSSLNVSSFSKKQLGTEKSSTIYVKNNKLIICYTADPWVGRTIYFMAGK